MTISFDSNSEARVRTLGAGARFLVLLILAIAAGCASTPDERADDTTRRIPPAVSDSSHNPEGTDPVAVRPRVSVDVQGEQDSGLQTTGAAKLLQRETRRCYRLALQVNRALEGTVVYEAIVTSNGRVAGVEQVSTSASSTRLERCVERILHKLRFDLPRSKTAMIRRLYVRLDLRREIFDPQAPPIEEENLKK
ncbi:AgmX/PglI C-terminal domain-containing protein [Persicimonas caeni]|uniref:AgmX/PglI C-terminal domain-containing protein n=1 Tax=Persicimonas caeni TaxID=2292766 RepID=UPI00143DD38A|nr:AgmX/PglI C-terminal domain-containing protein [Persicimonas caeni]